ncbi:peptidase S8 [bacterium]|nr:peptidase S8 [bacterium]
MNDRQAYSKVQSDGAITPKEGMMDMARAVWANSRHLEVIRVPESWEMTKGEGVTIAVLDSGVDRMHPDLKESVVGVFDTTGGDGSDSTGHGTHCIGLIAAQQGTDGVTGVSPDAKIVSIKVIDKNNHGSVTMLRDGLRKAIDMNVDIINLSLGTKTHPGPDVELLLDEAEEKGILVVAASGNESGPVMFPARFDNVIAVSGIDEKGIRSDFSNYGIENLVCAPSVALVSTFPGNRYAKMSGTSMAAAVITGILSLGISILKNQKSGNIRSRELILDLLPTVSNDSGDPGRDVFYGWGVLDSTRFCRNVSNGL